MSEARDGDRVAVNYTGKLEDGTVFDTSAGQGPLEFVVGEGRVVPGFEEAVRGMSPGEMKTAKIEPDQAYGDHRSDLMITINRREVPEHIDLRAGQRLALRAPDDQQVSVTVARVTDNDVLLDANHPLAGKTLVFDIELVEIR